jgi:hypothetical protein
VIKVVSCLVVNGRASGVAVFLAAPPVGLAFDDEFVGCGAEPADGPSPDRMTPPGAALVFRRLDIAQVLYELAVSGEAKPRAGHKGLTCRASS